VRRLSALGGGSGARALVGSCLDNVSSEDGAEEEKGLINGEDLLLPLLSSESSDGMEGGWEEDGVQQCCLSSLLVCMQE